MKHILSLLLLFIPAMLRAQGTPDSLVSEKRVLDVVDSLTSMRVEMPDTLVAIHQAADSIQSEFRNSADSLNTAWRQAISEIDGRVEELNGKIDSLERINLPTDDHLNPLRQLQERRQKIEMQFREKLDALKSRTTDKLAALDLPPQYQQPIRELTAKVNNVGLSAGGIDIPKLDVSGLEFPEINLGQPDIPGINASIPDAQVPELNGLAGDLPIEQAKEIAGQAEKMNIPSAIEEQASRIDGLDEIQKQSGVVEQHKAQFENLQDREKAKAKAVEMTRKAAVDHFAGKEKQLQAAMDKVSKYKQKYSSVASIKDLPKRSPNPMKAKPFVERLVPGLFLQYQRKNAYLLDVNPYVGYRISGRFTAGGGWNHRYAYLDRRSGFDSRARVFGPRAYVDFLLGKGFIAHLEGEVINTFVPSTLRGNPDTGTRQWVWGMMTGIKKEYKISRSLKGTALIQYNLFDKFHKAPYVDRLNSRVGVEYVIGAKR